MSLFKFEILPTLSCSNTYVVPAFALSANVTIVIVISSLFAFDESVIDFTKEVKDSFTTSILDLSVHCTHLSALTSYLCVAYGQLL